MTCHTDSNDDMFVLLEQRVREVTHILVSTLSNHMTYDYGDLVRLRDLWVDIFTVLLERRDAGDIRPHPRAWRR